MRDREGSSFIVRVSFQTVFLDNRVTFSRAYRRTIYVSKVARGRKIWSSRRSLLAMLAAAIVRAASTEWILNVFWAPLSLRRMADFYVRPVRTRARIYWIREETRGNPAAQWLCGPLFVRAASHVHVLQRGGSKITLTVYVYRPDGIRRAAQIFLFNLTLPRRAGNWCGLIRSRFLRWLRLSGVFGSSRASEITLFHFERKGSR